jgi:hypothetical protein
MSLVDAFREIRRQWFAIHIQSHAPEREWEDEEHERRRLSDNAEMRQLFDQQTEAIVRQSDCLGVKVCPLCYDDLLRKG